MSEIANPSTAVQRYAPEDFQRRQPMPVIKAMSKMMAGAVNDALPAFMRGQAQSLLKAMQTECTKTPKLLEATPESLFRCVLTAAQMGLQLGGPMGQAYLIPFKGTVNLIVGYKGLIQLVNRSGQVGILHAETVWEGDKYEVTKGSDPKIVHVPKEPQTLDEALKRKSIAFYATVKTKSGTVFQTMSRIEAEVHRSRFAMFKNGGPWTDHFEAMSMKTCIIKLCKYLPMSTELQIATSAPAEDEGVTGSLSPMDYIGTPSNPIQIAGVAEEDEPKTEAKPVDDLKKTQEKVHAHEDNRPDEEREPENLPAPAESPNQRVERKVRRQAGKAADGQLFGNGQSQMPPDGGSR